MPDTEGETPKHFLLVCNETPHDAVLTDPGPHPLAVAQTVRRLTALSLWHSKVLPTEPPATILKKRGTPGA